MKTNVSTPSSTWVFSDTALQLDEEDVALEGLGGHVPRRVRDVAEELREALAHAVLAAQHSGGRDHASAVAQARRRCPGDLRRSGHPAWCWKISCGVRGMTTSGCGGRLPVRTGAETRAARAEDAARAPPGDRPSRPAGQVTGRRPDRADGRRGGARASEPPAPSEATGGARASRQLEEATAPDPVVTVLGTGTMGPAMVRSTAPGRSPRPDVEPDAAKAQCAHGLRGRRPSGSAAEAAQGADVVQMMPPDADAAVKVIRSAAPAAGNGVAAVLHRGRGGR